MMSPSEARQLLRNWIENGPGEHGMIGQAVDVLLRDPDATEAERHKAFARRLHAEARLLDARAAILEAKHEARKSAAREAQRLAQGLPAASIADRNEAEALGRYWAEFPGGGARRRTAKLLGKLFSLACPFRPPREAGEEDDRPCSLPLAHDGPCYAPPRFEAPASDPGTSPADP